MLCAWPIPDTGQTTCYDETGMEIDCAGTGQDGEYLINPPSYTKLDANGNDLPDEATSWAMVRDNVTGLIWEVKTDDGSVHDKDNEYTWYCPDCPDNGDEDGTPGDGTDTQDFIAALNAGSGFGGFTDWRLPTREELRSIADYGEYYPAIDTEYFPNSVSSYTFYWSSSTPAAIPDSAWGVSFDYGYDYGDNKSDSRYVRAVRGGQGRSLDHWAIGPGDTVTDTRTGLMWRRTTDSQRTWTDALNHCDDMTTAGYEDWRLPTVKELASIATLDRYNPAIDTSVFPDTVSSNYWSSSTSVLPDSAWSVDFNGGYGSDDHKSYGRYVRAVRGGQVWFLDHLIISEPKQASYWIAGSPMQIAWDPVGSTGTVTIQLSKDGGLTYETIVNATENDGQHTWTVPEISTVNGVIRIRHDTIDNIGSSVGLFSIIDQIPPAVTAINRRDDGPQTSETSVRFTVAFREPVTGVNDPDFSLIRTDSLSGGSITDITGAGRTRTVTVSGYVGQGTLGLELIDDDSITDNAGNPLGGPGPGNGNFTGGDVYEIALAPEIRVSPTALTMAEPDGAADFTLSLSRRPAAPVSIPLFSANRNEFVFTHMNGVEIAEDPTVVLDAGNWYNGVTVTAAARDDYRPDGDKETHVETAPATSADPNFHLMDPPNVAVTVLDNYEGIWITDMAPTVGAIGNSLPVTVNGAGFGPNPSVVLFQDFFQIYSVPDPSVNSDRTQITMTLPNVESEGLYDLMVCNGNECAGLTGAITFYNAEAAEAMKRKKAVIVAGSGPYADNDLWDATRNNAELAHAALVAQGYAPENIQFLSAGPVEGDVDETATRESLEHALLYWAQGLDNPNRNKDVPPETPADELIVYLIGHGDEEIFQINGTTSPAQRIQAGEFAEWFRRLQYVSPAMPGKLIFVYDACLAGSFLPPLANPGTKERYVVASVPNQSRAWFMDEGEFSFSGYFWDKVRSTGRLYRSFVSARDLMFLGQDQQAQIDIDGDGLPDYIDLDAIGKDIIIGRGRIAASDPPEIGRVMADVELNCERGLDIWVSDLYAKNGIDEAWAMVESPADVSADPRNPGIFRERITLLDDARDGEYETRYSKCVRNGTYQFIFYLKDRKGVTISAPRQAVVHRNCDASLADVVWILKALVGIPQPSVDADDFQRMDRDENGRLGLPDAVETLRLVGEL
jgi:hypothetical protein